MTTGKALQHTALISMTNGKIIGQIKDLYLDPDLNQVAAVHLGKEGVLRRQAHAIGREAIQVYGEDVWLVTGPDSIVNRKQIPDANHLVLLSDLRGREIHTEGGTHIGTVEDVILDAQANVLGFTLGKMRMQGPLGERKTIARAAVTGMGGKGVPMTAMMDRAEAITVAEG
ncbi:MAG: PRC-barrel domain-containing protein [Anaerolineales bacterium]